jgi:membrane-bound lytic murein transglycosylase F
LVNRLIFLFTFLATVFISCSDLHHSSKNLDKPIACDLDSIRKRGKLIAVTDFNSTDYFIYKGEPMGFNYELLKSFSDNIGIDLEVITENHPDKALSMLNTGKADLLANSLTVSSAGEKDVRYTEPVGETRQVLVQRKPRNWSTMSAEALEKMLIRNQTGLARKTVYVQAGSSHAEQLISQVKEIGDSVNIIEVPYESEKLIQNVASGEIDYTVCNENLAQVNATYYPNIDVSTPVSFSQNIAWGLRRNNSDALLSELNRWIVSFRATESYALLYAKYFRNPWSISIVRSDFYALNTGKVSPYDDMIRKFSARINWDWRLLASLICQESHFNQNVESYSGAFGLMQIMPETGKNFGIDITSSPENNLKAGISYINWLHSIFNPRIPDIKERINFILAAYNAGPGPVLDAMKLAEKNGMNPLKWEGSVALWLLNKPASQYYDDIVAKNGYYKAVESVNFVNQVLARFEHYKNIIPEQKFHPF